MSPKLEKSLTEYFKKEFADLILEKLKTGHSLSKFKVNPFVLTALSSGVFGKPTSMNMAKALLYPRVFGTSVTTTFGDKMQKLCVRYLGAEASAIPGMDIAFQDKIESKKVIMQLKAGPNNINKDDVDPILEKMRSAYRLLRQNRTDDIPTFAIGITYGTTAEISSHFKKIQGSEVGYQLEVPIYIGRDFWYRLTGEKDFYANMINIFVDLFEKEDYHALLEEDLKKLAKEIEAKYFLNGKFDTSKV